MPGFVGQALVHVAAVAVGHEPRGGDRQEHEGHAREGEADDVPDPGQANSLGATRVPFREDRIEGSVEAAGRGRQECHSRHAHSSSGHVWTGVAEGRRRWAAGSTRGGRRTGWSSAPDECVRADETPARGRTAPSARAGSHPAPRRCGRRATGSSVTMQGSVPQYGMFPITNVSRGGSAATIRAGREAEREQPERRVVRRPSPARPGRTPSPGTVPSPPGPAGA